jgi:hypothetical protein
MKRLLVLLALVVVSVAGAAPVPADDQAPDTTNAIPVIILSAPAPASQVNEIRRRRAVYTGSVVQVIKTHRLLDLVNPFAPPAAGSGAANTAFDPITGKPVGLKLAAVSY